MNHRVKKELEKVTTYIPPYDESSNTIIIPKQVDCLEIIKIGGSYLIKVADYIINPPSNFTLSDNWNNGIVPKCKCMNVEVIDIQGKMVKVNASGFDHVNKVPTEHVYMGLWLPAKAITVMEIY